MTTDKDRVLILHILDAIQAIHAFVKDLDISEFEESDLISSAVIKKFEIIGEASNRLSDSFRHNHPDIPWSNIIGMRNILIHDYIGTDLEAIWNTIQTHLQQLQSALNQES